MADSLHEMSSHTPRNYTVEGRKFVPAEAAAMHGLVRRAVQQYTLTMNQILSGPNAKCYFKTKA